MRAGGAGRPAAGVRSSDGCPASQREKCHPSPLSHRDEKDKKQGSAGATLFSKRCTVRCRNTTPPTGTVESEIGKEMSGGEQRRKKNKEKKPGGGTRIHLSSAYTRPVRRALAADT